jgi:hypothetical protein
MYAFKALLLVFLGGCGLKQMMPEGPVFSLAEHAATFGKVKPPVVHYTGKPRVDFPVLPLLPWGVAYDVDIVIVSKHPDWNMHEYARLATPQGPVWLAKDASEPDLEQSIVANIEDIDHWWPEIPVPRKSSELLVRDRSSEDTLDVEIGYENINGEPVLMTYRGPMPTKLQSKRNGSAMGHSRSRLIAVLDLSHRNFGREASMTINGERVPIKRLLGLVPFRMVLQQVQGGLATAEYRLGLKEGKLVSRHSMDSGAEVELGWTREESRSQVILRQANEIRSLAYFFVRRGEALELSKLQVEQWGREESTCEIHFSPSLPDLRMSFEGEIESLFVIDINGQLGHARGKVVLVSEGEEAKLTVLPQSPWWVADRPLESRIRFDGDDSVSISISRIEVPE